MAKKTLWLSYDLGIKGDYNSLYTWLDKHKARECGDSFAYFEFDCKTEDIRQEIANDLKNSNIVFGSNDRVYLVWKDHENKVHGSFIIGHRKQSPWAGYYSADTEQSIDS